MQHPASLTHRPVEAVGLEHVDDLADDLLRALDVAAAAGSQRLQARSNQSRKRAPIEV